MAENPPIQVLMEDFAADHKRDLVFVEEHNCYYVLQEKRKYYKPLKKDDLKAIVGAFLEKNYVGNITESIFNNAFSWLRIKVNKKLPDINTQFAIFKDEVVIDLLSLETRPYNKKTDIIFYYIPCVSPSKKDKCPVFLNFLNQIIVDNDGKPDEQLLYLIQEMFGYYLLSTQEPPVAFFLVGGGSNGKSTLLFVLEQMMGGQQFIMSNSLENLTTKGFHVQELRFKRLNICSEEQSKYIHAGNFKTITEGTRMHAEIKFGDQISFSPKTKHVFSTNNMPTFDVLDYATKRRIQILPFNKQFLPHETDKTLKTKDFKESRFYKELPAIIAWAIEGGKRLIEHNYTFTTSQLVIEEFEEYESVVSSTVNFFRDSFGKVAADEVDAEFYSIARLYKIYLYWCKNDTNRKPVNANMFKKELRQELKIKQLIVGWDQAEESHKRGFWLKKTQDSIMNQGDYSQFLPDIDEDTTINFNNN